MPPSLIYTHRHSLIVSQVVGMDLRRDEDIGSRQRERRRRIDPEAPLGGASLREVQGGAHEVLPVPLPGLGAVQVTVAGVERLLDRRRRLFPEAGGAKPNRGHHHAVVQHHLPRGSGGLLKWPGQDSSSNQDYEKLANFAHCRKRLGEVLQ